MKANFFRNGLTDGVVVLKAEDGQYYSYDSNERWNGTEYKGWKSDAYGEAIDDDIHYITPSYVETSEDIYEIEYYTID